MKLTIDVTQEDIDQVLRHHQYDAASCPVARALRRRTALPWAVHFEMTAGETLALFLELPNGQLKVNAPPDVGAFVLEFDKRAHGFSYAEYPLLPLTFTLDVPDSLYEHAPAS